MQIGMREKRDGEKRTGKEGKFRQDAVNVYDLNDTPFRPMFVDLN